MRATIVLIDDEPDKRLLLERLLKRAFPENPVRSFGDCAEALPLVAAPTPKVVITNGKVGQKDGIEFTRYVHRELKVPVVVVTLRGELEKKALAAGASAFVETGDSEGIRTAISSALNQVASI